MNTERQILAEKLQKHNFFQIVFVQNALPENISVDT